MSGQNATPSVTTDAEPSCWNYARDPRLEAEITRIRNIYPPQLPAGLARFKALLGKLGHPERHLPPVFHVAGTNGKGSTVAFLQSILQAGGLRVHRFISPHMVRFSERIVIGGQEIPDDLLCDMIAEVDAVAAGEGITFFEFFTALALLAFARHPADAALLETGLGGLLDATNVVDDNITAVLTHISFDHMRLLGDTLPKIALQKAGIIKRACPVVVGAQRDPAVLAVFEQTAKDTGAGALRAAGRDFHAGVTSDGFRYRSENTDVTLPLPALLGAHQIDNAAVAIAALEAGGFGYLCSQHILSDAMRTVYWPGRMQRVTAGALRHIIPPQTELWVDGAHNDSGADILRAQAQVWGHDTPLHLVTAFKDKKAPEDFYRRLTGIFTSIHVVDFPIDAPMVASAEIAALCTRLGHQNVHVSESPEAAFRALCFPSAGAQRILVAGSLYLAGYVLKVNDASR